MITLYHCTDARSFRCLWALEAAATPYELKVLPFPPRLREPAFLERFPNGTVPLMIDGDSTLFESAAILEWIANRYAPQTLAVPADHPDYASWLNWLHYGEASLTTPLATMLRYAMFLPKEQRSPAVVADFQQVFLDRLQIVESALEKREFLAADRFTAADISVGYALQLSGMLRLHDRFPPAVSAYWKRLQELPSYQTAREKQKAAEKQG